MEKSVLLADDKQGIVKIIMSYSSGTCRVSYKENPLKAIVWLWEDNLSDLIISDLNIPEMSGGEFLVYLKASDMLSHIPALVLSSIESSSNRIRSFEEGVEDFTLKPLNPKELRVRVKRILR